MNEIEQEIQSLVESFTVETDYDYGYGGMVEVHRVDRDDAAGLIRTFVRPILDRAHAAEQSLGEADAEIERLKATIARVEALESAWRERPARDNARWELGTALGPRERRPHDAQG